MSLVEAAQQLFNAVDHCIGMDDPPRVLHKYLAPLQAALAREAEKTVETRWGFTSTGPGGGVYKSPLMTESAARIHFEREPIDDWTIRLVRLDTTETIISERTKEDKDAT